MRMMQGKGVSMLKAMGISLVLALVFLVPMKKAMAADLLHNSVDTGSTKWSGQGGWGVTGGKYGEFTCDTCHETNNKANIKNVRMVISSPDGTNLPNGSPSVNVLFKNVTSHGDDSAAHLSSNRVCEVCHSASQWHNYNTTNNSGGLGHPTPKQVCTNCHVHSTGFKAACGGCHGNPPTTPVIGGDYGLVGTPRASNALTPGQVGAHFTHTDPTKRALVCDTCHNVTDGSGKMPGQSGTIQLGILGFGGTVNRVTYTPYSSATSGYPIKSSAAGTTIAPASTNYATANICSNLYCHGGGSPGRAPLTGGTNQTPRWDGVNQSACGTCHGATATSPPTTGNHLKHAGYATGYSYSCDLCHPATDISHVQGNMRWQLNTADPRVGAAAGYQANGSGVTAAAGSTNNLAPSVAYGQCSNLYCHGTTSPTWGTTLAADCTGCHGNDEFSGTPMDKNAHKAHVNNRSVRFDHFDFKCNECHANTVDSTNRAISNKTLHVNTTKDVAWGATATRAGVQAYNGTGASCATTYCHSNGRGGAPYVTPANWTAVADNTEGTYACNSCHGGFAGQANPMATQRHANHITTSPVGGIAHKGIACDKCHDMTIGPDGQSIDHNSGLHINKSFNVTFAKFANRSGNYVYGTQTCQNTYCHGRATNAVWTTTAINNCGSCHRGNNSTAGGALSRAHVKHYNSATLPVNTTTEGWTNVNRSVNTNVFMCGTCHGVDPNTQHMNGPAMPNGAAAEVEINLPFSVLPARQYPAGGVPVITRGTSVVADGANYFYSQQTSCAVYCHSNGRGGAPVNVMQWDNSTTTCGNCHNKAGDTGTSVTWSGAHTKHLTSPISTAASCGTCHAATASTNNVLLANRRDRHPNGFINVTGNSVASGDMRWNGTNCTNAACHYNAATPAWEGGRLATRCSSCHGSTAVSGVPMIKNAHQAHVANTSLRFNGFNFGCRECHSGVVYDNNTSIQNTALHVNGTQNVAWGALATTTGSAAYNYGTGACTATYCHSDGNGTFKAPATTWRAVADGTQGTVGCNYCHGGTMADGTATIMTDERHNNHVKQSPSPGIRHAVIGCDKCHDATVGPDGSSIDAAAGTHLNKVRDINFAKFANRSGSWVGGATRRCDNTYCHGRGNPLWSTTTVNNCGSCHRANNSGTNSLSAPHLKHYASGTSVTNTNGWNNTNGSTDANHIYYCGVCHNVLPDTDHVNGPATANGAAAQIVFNIPRIPPGYTRGNTFTYGTGQNLDGANYIYSSGTTCDVYCHSDGNNGPSKTSFNWTSTTFACGACHNNQGDGAASPTWSAAHTKHIRGYAEGGNPNFGCVVCHKSTTTNGTSILSKRVHINGYRNVSTNTWAGGTWNGTVCANVYCHSDGKASPTFVTNQAWTTFTANCLGCHGGAVSSGGNNSALSGKHAKHVNSATYAMKCAACHYKTVDATNNLALKNFSGVRYHVNKSRNVTLNATYGGTWTSPNCASVYCHSNGAASPSYVNPNWSTLTSNCTTCHGGDATQGSVMASNRHGAHLNNAANLGINFTCNVCHALTVSNNTAISTYANHTNKLREVAFGSYSGSWTGGTTCSSTKCHAGRNPLWTAATTTDHRCVKCHGAVGATNPTPAQMAPGNGRDLDGSNGFTSPTKDIQVGTHQQHLSGQSSTNIATVRCIECHRVPNNATDNNHLGRRSAEVTFTNASAAGKNGATPTFTASAGAAAGQCSNVYCHGAAMPKGDTSGTKRIVGATTIFWNQTSYRTRNAVPTAADCGVCHGNPPTTGTVAVNHTAYVGQPTTSCTECHSHFNANGTLNTPALHINGKLEAATGCNSCHDYDTVGAGYVGGVWSGGYWGKNSRDGLSPNEGWGAHAKHINYIKTRLGYIVALNATSQTYGAAGTDSARVCGTCHTNNVANHTTAGSTVRTINFGDSSFLMGSTGGTSLLFGTTFPADNPLYNGVSGTSKSTTAKTCSNISCHYFTSPNW